MPDIQIPEVVSPGVAKESERGAEFSTADAEPKLAAKKPSRKPKKIESLAQLIAFAYRQRGKAVSPKPKVIKHISQNPVLEADTFQELLTLANADIKLAVPVQLLIAGYGISHSGVRASIHDFVGTVLGQHPAFGSEEMNAALRNLPNGPDIPEALSLIANTDYRKLQSLPDKIRRKKRELTALRINATYSLALWFVETRGLMPRELAQHLFAALWQPDGNKVHDDVHQLRLLIANRDVDAVGAACATFKNHADNMSSLASKAQRAEADALEKVQSLNASSDQLKSGLKARDAQIAAIETDLARQQLDHENELAHIRDEHEMLRARVLRRIKEDVKLLDEGLHALQRDPPKIRVMEDHAERAADGLRNEIKQLEAEK